MSQSSSFNSQVLQMINDFIERVIDSEITTAEALAVLKNSVDNTTDISKENKEIARQILGLFSNGFKKEIKDHITKEAKEHDRHEEILERLVEILVENHKFVESMAVNIDRYQEKIETYSEEISLQTAKIGSELAKFHSFQFWAKLVISIVIAVGTLAAAIIKLI